METHAGTQTNLERYVFRLTRQRQVKHMKLLVKMKARAFS